MYMCTCTCTCTCILYTVFLLKIRQTRFWLGNFCDEFQGLKYEILWRGIIIGRN